MKSDLHLHIDKLVLDGFSKTDGFYIKKAIQAELKVLLEAGSQNHKTLSSYKMIAAPSIHIDARTRPAQIGKQIAQSLHGSLTKSNTRS